MDRIQEILKQAFTDGWMPFFMVAGGGKPKPKMGEIIQIVLILGFLWWRMDVIETKIDSHELRREKVQIILFEKIDRNRTDIYNLGQRVSEMWGTLNAEE